MAESLARKNLNLIRPGLQFGFGIRARRLRLRALWRDSVDTEHKTDRVRSRREFAERLGICTRTLGRMDRRGELPPRVRITDKLIGYRESDIAAFIESRVMR